MSDMWYRTCLAVAAKFDALTAEHDALRAELAAEREAHEILLAERNMRHFQMTQSIRAKRDELRELLREAYPHIWPGERALADNLRARIYAALDMGGGDE